MPGGQGRRPRQAGDGGECERGRTVVHLQAVREDQRNNVAAVERGVGPPAVGGKRLMAERIGGGKRKETFGLLELDGNPRSFCSTHDNGRIASPTNSRRSLTFFALWPGREAGIAKRTHEVPRSKGRRSEVAAAARRQLLPDGDNRATQHEVRKAAGGQWITESVGARTIVSLLITYEREGPCGAAGAGGAEGCRGRSLLQTEVERATSGVKALGAWTGRGPGGP